MVKADGYRRRWKKSVTRARKPVGGRFAPRTATRVGSLRTERYNRKTGKTTARYWGPNYRDDA
jgi:hypothetical protein